jgi:hypothetical protein
MTRKPTCGSPAMRDDGGEGPKHTLKSAPDALTDML